MKTIEELNKMSEKEYINFLQDHLEEVPTEELQILIAQGCLELIKIMKMGDSFRQEIERFSQEIERRKNPLKFNLSEFVGKKVTVQ
jgi:DNA-binding PadR family transcriptional regulator